jgi:hypothetical protein
MNRVFESIGRGIARYLDKPAAGYEPFTPTDPAALHATIRKGDVLLVEGNSHVSGVIKYLTQSTWSHAALYVGSLASMETGRGTTGYAARSQSGAGSRGRSFVEVF